VTDTATLAWVSLNRRRRRRLRIAPIRRRLLASLIDVTLALLAGILAIGAYTGAVAMLGRKEAPGVRSLPKMMPKITGSKRASIALHVCMFALSVLLTGRRGPGSRVAGIRLVDARAGEPVSLGQAALRAGTQRAWQLLVRRLRRLFLITDVMRVGNPCIAALGARLAPPVIRKRVLTTRLGKAERLKQPDLRSKIEELKREHADDRDAFEQAMKEMYRENQVRPYTACLPALMQLPLGLAIEVPALWTPLHQGLPDKLAGTIVISDR